MVFQRSRSIPGQVLLLTARVLKAETSLWTKVRLSSASLLRRLLLQPPNPMHLFVKMWCSRICMLPYIHTRRDGDTTPARSPF